MARPGQSDEERLAIEQQVFSNEDLNLDSVAHTRVRRSGVYTQVYHFCLGKAFQEGRATGATGGSMPVGSGRLFIHLSSIYRTFVLPNCRLLPALALLSLRAHARSSVMYC
jgi:hypothetical protein